MKNLILVSIVGCLLLVLSGLVVNSKLKYKNLLVLLATCLSLLIICFVSFGTQIKDFLTTVYIKRAVSQIDTSKTSENTVTVKRKFKFASQNGTRLSAGDS